MTKRITTSEPGKSGPAVAVFIAVAAAVLLVVHWLARLGWLGLAGVAAAVAGVLLAWWAVWPKRRLPRNRVRYMRLRLRLRLYPGPGHATLFELWLRWGPGAAARRARRARPSLSLWTRRFRPSQTSVLVGRAQYGRGLRVPVEEHVIFIAPPRKGKSGALAEIIEQYPGPVVVTTTRGDLHTLTARSRAAGGPVRVWNPQRLAAVPSTMRWDLLGGCEDPATAIRRAVPLSAVASYKGEGEDFWAAAIELWLQTVLHVAALRRGSMDLVHYWALSRTPDSFLGALPGAGGEAERWGALIRDLMTSAATKTTDTIRYMAAANLGFMLDPVLREAITPGPGMFSPAGFVRDGGTLYLIAESRDERPSPVAGLFAALVTEIYHQAALAAARMPGGRLDPPMLWALDEVTQTCPLPLPSMLADAGGRGIQIMPVVHGAAQLRTRWGRDGARTILDTASVKVFLPGISDPETLETGARLSDTIAGRERGHEHESRHPVMTEGMISRLPARRDGTGYALLLRDGLTPVIARPPVIWHGSWYKQLTRRARRRYAPPALLPLAPAGPDDLAGEDTAPLPAAALAPAPAAPAGHAWHNGDCQPAATGNDQPRRSRAARAWDGTGGAS
jgi:type IV secretion system protein VirD4